MIKTLKTKVRGKARRCHFAIVWLDKRKNYRVYLDLNAAETKWLGGIAAEFGLTINQFIFRFYRRLLPAPAYARRQHADCQREPADLAMFKVTCSEPEVWRQLAGIAKYQKLKGGAEEQCVTSILSDLEMFNDDLLGSPKTGEVLCENDAVDALVFRTNLTEEPDGRRGFAMKALNGRSSAVHCG
jgi:hypothetical protein